MAIHRTYPKKDVAYFVTFTCVDWLSLISKSNSHAAFYKWFNVLKSLEVSMLGYVIMPNHFHGLIFLPSSSKRNVNQLISNGKRFIAYEIVKQLTLQNNFDLIDKISVDQNAKNIEEKRKHRIFQRSSDYKEIYDKDMLFTKLNYIHRNPCKGRWYLADNYVDYQYSSAGFYELNNPDPFVTHYDEYF